MILTETQLRNAAFNARSLNRYYTYSSIQFNPQVGYDLFISHSFKDKDLVIGLYHLFATAGYTVYIDWIDDSTLDRSNVDSKTAALIKTRIQRSKGTAYIATANSTTSKWCPWELGVADGMLHKVCILPIMNTEFSGQEYLNLYPYLEYGKYTESNTNDFWICDQNIRWKHTRLREWLNAHSS